MSRQKTYQNRKTVLFKTINLDWGSVWTVASVFFFFQINKQNKYKSLNRNLGQHMMPENIARIFGKREKKINGIKYIEWCVMIVKNWVKIKSISDVEKVRFCLDLLSFFVEIEKKNKKNWLIYSVCKPNFWHWTRKTAECAQLVFVRGILRAIPSRKYALMLILFALKYFYLISIDLSCSHF